MAKKTNIFNVKSFDNNKITIEEQRKERSPLSLFFVKNGRLIFTISLLFSFTLFLIAIYFAMINMEESSIVMYESNGVKVTFDSTDNSILNGVPITEQYAKKVYDNVINMNKNNVVIEVNKRTINRDNDNRTIVYYSDGNALVKYDDGTYMMVYSVSGKYGIDKDGVIDGNATTSELTGRVEYNESLGLTLLYLSDGSIEITKDNTTIFIENSNITNTNDTFFTNVSGVSLPIKKDGGSVYYSDGVIKENNNIIVDGKRYGVLEKKNIYDNIKVIYYENGYAEILRDNLSIMVKNKDHIIYDEESIKIVENTYQSFNIKDVMDYKEIELYNTNSASSHYVIVLEETDNYKLHNVNKRLDNNFIRFNVSVNDKIYYNNILNNNLKDSSSLEGISSDNNIYLLHEGTLDSMSTTTVKLGLWIDYDSISNQYMNSTFIGTVKVYVESLD